MKCGRFFLQLVLLVSSHFISGCLVYTFRQENDGTYYCKLPKASFTVYATRKSTDPTPDYSWMPCLSNSYYTFTNTNTILLQQFVAGKEMLPPRRLRFSKLRNDDPCRCKLLFFHMEESGLAILSLEGEDNAKHEMQDFLKGRKVRALKWIK